MDGDKGVRFGNGGCFVGFKDEGGGGAGLTFRIGCLPTNEGERERERERERESAHRKTENAENRDAFFYVKCLSIYVNN